MNPIPKQSYHLIDDDIFHKNFESCVDPTEITEIQVYFCVYSITQPFYVEGTPMLDEDTNIYGRVFPQYNIPYPCLKWVSESQAFLLPKMSYECPSISDSIEDTEEKSQETLHFENKIHQYFLSMFNDEIYNNTDILNAAYKGFSHNKESNSVYVFYDSSPINAKLKEGHRWVLSEELDTPIFKEYPFLTKVKEFQSPTLLYMVDIRKPSDFSAPLKTKIVEPEEDQIIIPVEHPILGCFAYYFTEKPFDESHLDRFACIQSRIMYEVRIDGDKVYYMGDNMEEYRDLFDMGLLMCSTLHFEENGVKMIAIKNSSHIHRL